jgi:hypothetical protein
MLSFLDAPSPKIPRGGVCYVAKDIKAVLGQSVACCDREPIKKAPPGGVGRGRSRSAYPAVQNDSGLSQGPAGRFRGIPSLQ